MSKFELIKDDIKKYLDAEEIETFNFTDFDWVLYYHKFTNFENKLLTDFSKVRQFTLDNNEVYIMIDLGEEGKYCIYFQDTEDDDYCRYTLDDLVPMDKDTYYKLREEVNERIELWNQLKEDLIDEKIEKAIKLEQIINQ